MYLLYHNKYISVNVYNLVLFFKFKHTIVNKGDYMDKKIFKILSYFSKDVLEIILKTDLVKDKPTEIKLRLNQEISYLSNSKIKSIKGLKISQNILDDIFYKICDYSKNTFENQISHGFITIKEGCRVGIGGQFTYNKDNIKILKQLTSLNIRILYDEIFNFNMSDINDFKGVLIVGPPHSGKTTLIKTISKHLCNDNNICICDEREELYINDINADFISGIDKTSAIEMATRTLNPDIIVCDEIGSENEAKQMLSSLNTGVKFICTAHAKSLKEIKNRPNINLLLQNRVFNKIIILHDNSFLVKEIIDV